MKKGKILVLGILGVLLLMLVGCSDTLTPTASTIKGTAVPNSLLTVSNASGQTVASGITNASGQYAISGVPAGPDIQITADNGSKVNVYYNSGSGDVYADGMTSANTELVDLLNQLKASGVPIDSVELAKLQTWLAFAGVTGTSAVNLIKEIWTAEGKQLFDEYKVVSGWTTEYWDNKQKEEFQKYVHDTMAANYAAGAGNLTDQQKANALYATASEMFNDLASASSSSAQTKLLAKLGFALIKADWFTGQNIADAAQQAGLFSVTKQSAVFKLENFKNTLAQYQDYMLYSIIYATVNGYVSTISDATTKGIFTAALTLLNNYVTACLVNSTKLVGTEAERTANTADMETQKEALKTVTDIYIPDDVNANVTGLREELAEEPANVAELDANTDKIFERVDATSMEALAKTVTYTSTADLPVVRATQ